MCGIAGVICPNKTGFNRDHINTLKQMAYVTALRGEDSTGLFYVTNKGDVQVHKEATPSFKFVGSEEWKAADKELFAMGRAAVIHCRAATKGSKTDENAHPFRVDHIILVHNGTINNTHALTKTDVDSHAIAHLLAEKDTVEGALQSLSGAYALVWYNLKTGKLHAVRNSQRPFIFATMKDGSFVFASEVGIMSLCARRNGLTWDKEHPPAELDPGELMTIDLDKYGDNVTFEKINIDYKNPYTGTFGATTTNLVPYAHKPTIPAGVSSPYRSPDELTPLQAAELAKMGAYQPAMNSGQYGKWIDRNAWRKFLNPGQEIVVEALDYVPVNPKDPLGTNYYTFASIHAEGEAYDGMTVFWETRADAEEDMISYCDNKFYSVITEYNLGKVNYEDPQLETAIWKTHGAKLIETIPVEQLQ